MTTDEIANHTLSLLRPLDAKVDRVQATLDDHTGHLQVVERRLTKIENQLGVFTSDVRGDTDRMRIRLDEFDRRLRKIEDASA